MLVGLVDVRAKRWRSPREIMELPALTGRGYENMASREFLRVTYGQVTDAERRRVRQELEAYCGLDTEGMVDIVRELEKVAAGK